MNNSTRELNISTEIDTNIDDNQIVCLLCNRNTKIKYKRVKLIGKKLLSCRLY